MQQLLKRPDFGLQLRNATDAEGEVDLNQLAEMVNASYVALEASLILAKNQNSLQSDRFETAIENLPLGITMFDANNKLVLCNGHFLQMYGLFKADIVPNMSLRNFFVKFMALDLIGEMRTSKSARFAISHLKVGESRIHEWILSDGRFIEMTMIRMLTGGWLAIHSDVSEHRKAIERVSHLARHDSLTGLANRIHFRESLTHSLATLQRDSQLAILCMDLDLFKQVNDTLGHPVGDVLLKQVATRLRDCLRNSDVIARLGGDEFAILMPIKQDHIEMVSLTGERIIAEISRPYMVAGHNINIGVSIGVSIAVKDATDADELIKNADMALYNAKDSGRGQIRFFEASMDAKMKARHSLESDLRRAIVEKQFELHYQPVINLATNKISSVEALIRWNHPTRGRVSPLDFIPLAEETGLINQIGQWVLQKACKDVQSWPGNLRVSVNVSPVQFCNRGFALTVANALMYSELSPQRLELEITEAVMLKDTESNIDTLNSLRDIGVAIAIDDFGAGYSSLGYLKKFKCDRLKIDRSFIEDIGNKPEALPVIRAIADLGTSFGMTITAEGIETKEQFDGVKLNGCSEAQGYLMSKPLPAEAILALLRDKAKAA